MSAFRFALVELVFLVTAGIGLALGYRLVRVSRLPDDHPDLVAWRATFEPRLRGIGAVALVGAAVLPMTLDRIVPTARPNALLVVSTGLILLAAVTLPLPAALEAAAGWMQRAWFVFCMSAVLAGLLGAFGMRVDFASAEWLILLAVAVVVVVALERLRAWLVRPLA